MFKSISLYFVLSVLIFNSCISNRGIKINTLKTNLTGKTIKSPLGNCIVDFDDIDKVTGERITELKQEKIFIYTPEKVKKFFDNRPFMTGMASLSMNNTGQFFLNLFFVVDTKYIKSWYNGIARESMLRITMINGDKVFLENILNDPGENDLKNNKLMYSAVFPVDKSNLKVLKKNEIDKIGVLWNGGFEEYNIYNIDFFMRQYECLKQIN